MALLRTIANRFFKGQIFFPAEKIEITDRSLVVRFPQNRINNDSNAVAEGQGIGSFCVLEAGTARLANHGSPPKPMDDWYDLGPIAGSKSVAGVFG